MKDIFYLMTHSTHFMYGYMALVTVSESLSFFLWPHVSGDITINLFNNILKQ